MSPVGLGTYRMSIKSNNHYDALKHAIELGCTLIDTSSNYTNGDAEKLIGKLKKERSLDDLTIITKAGYIQGSNLNFIQNLGDIEIVEIDESLKHSIDPIFLKDQLDRSLKRMEIKKVDVFLLHNPEYYFEQDNTSEKEFYNRIKKAFAFCEEMVSEGKIGCYGLSSNTLIHSPTSTKRVDLQKVYDNAGDGFKFIQFPLNYFEKGALGKHFNGKNLIERAKELGLTTVANRPLNAFTSEGLFRLAEYEFDEFKLDKEKAHEQLEYCLGLIEDKVQLRDPTLNLKKIPFIKQFCDIWCDLPSPDACQQVYFDHFFPLIAQIWGGNGLSPEESQPFYELYEYSEKYARHNMTSKVKILKRKTFPNEQDIPLTILCLNQYFEWGIDHVLVGMRTVKYIDQLKSFFEKE